MPTASEQIRNPWHEKRVWMRVGKDVHRDSIGAPVIFGWAFVVNGDGAAARYLESRGFFQRQGMWYAPKRVQSDVFWTPTEKEASALVYLCDEWDHSYDLRSHDAVLKSIRDDIADKVMACMGTDDARKAMDLGLKLYGATRARFYIGK